MYTCGMCKGPVISLTIHTKRQLATDYFKNVIKAVFHFQHQLQETNFSERTKMKIGKMLKCEQLYCLCVL